MITWISLPMILLLLTLVTVPQVAALLTAAFCWREKPADGAGQATTTVLVVVLITRKVGAPGVWIAAMIPQNPPSTV